jgi:condensin complex subunit 1
LCEQRAIPLTRLRKLMDLVISRVEDKSSVVRKQAIVLLTNMMKCNPFGDKVGIAHII